ncbi:4-alpha-glucanotransferase [Pseudoalteromonas sp. SSDWG2]|uniref:4-alpha-glucanotransferase n=1 Tax=Pseudoalteromonas sp. SSDWG2 TaxID=3139391 RepID=UPI003BA8FC55
MDAFSQACYLMGVGYEFISFDGQLTRFDDAVRKSALTAMGVEADNTEALHALNFELDAKPWTRLVEPITLVELNTPSFTINVSEAQYHQGIAMVSVLLKNDQQTRWQFNISDGRVIGDYVIADSRYVKLSFSLPHIDITCGFYDAVVRCADQLEHTQVWLTPEHAYNQSLSTKRQVGLSCGLYTLPTQTGVGIGDFDDLEKLLVSAATVGIDYVLLNPLHLLDTQKPDAASPYSPLSRLLLHPLYISIVRSEDCDAQLATKVAKAHADYLRDSDTQWLNYKRVYELKWPLLEQLFCHFKAHASTERRAQFTQFKKTNQVALATLPKGSGEFEHYLQWQAWTQRQQCQNVAKHYGMQIGLVNDLAVGVTKSSGEYDNFAEQFTQGAEIGAPPDAFARHGQNWGMPALHPKRMADNQFNYFRSLLAANMKDVGALRIDHVMALRRVWWCLSQQSGCYVYYPFEHLLSAVKILSHQYQCSVIGEDLGVVPQEVGEALANAKIASNTVYYFEQEHDAFIPPEQLKQLTLLMISNHDLPPFASWWRGGDIEQAQKLALINDELAQRLQNEREIVRQRMLKLLQSRDYAVSLGSEPIAIYNALCTVLAKSNCQLLTLQLDDLDGQNIALNVPGTDTQYPNWRRLLSKHGWQILANNDALLKELNRQRNG